MPATPTLNAKKAPGTDTGIRTDALGRRYRYKAGVRGRVALNLSEPQKKALAKKGLKNPGDKIRMKGSELKSLGIHLGESPHIDRMLSSHKKWRDTNSSDVSGRLSKLLSNGRGEWLKSGNTNEHRAFAAIVLGTILGKGVNKNAQSKSGITVTFNPGGRQNGFLAIKGKDGQEIGRVEFGDITKIQDKHIADFRKQFSALTAKAKQHKSVADEHKAMVEALSVRPEQLTGGKGDNKPDSSFNKKALAKGAKVESEHTNDPAKQKEIAKDHLTEDPKYYDKLEKVEKKNVATKTPSSVSKVADSKAVKAVKPVAVKTPKPVKLGKGGVIKKVEQVATQLAMGGRGLHPLAHALRTDHKEPLLKLSAAGHKRLIKHYNERLGAGQSHDDAVKSTVEHMKAIVK